jgi:uncharacterized protein (TIGR04552 family)
MHDIFQSSARLPALGLQRIGLQDVEQVRILLDGDSVIDWRQLAFRDADACTHFLRLVGFEADDPRDAAWLMSIHTEALRYLDTSLKHRLGDAVRRISDVRDLLLMASRPGDDQPDACLLLKTMHVIHHAAGRELLYLLPVARSELFRRVETRVFDTVDLMKQSGVRVVEFAASRKSLDSVYTKLLARTDNLAAAIHDRLRFRLVTESLDDLFRAAVCLTHALVPFNYVLPGESRNDLIDLDATLAADPRTRELAGLMQQLPGLNDRQAKVNRFSSNGFRVINFVADFPVRVDDLIDEAPLVEARHGRAVFLLAEFQLIDRETAASNERGANRHSLYKARQIERVIDRLNGIARNL